MESASPVTEITMPTMLEDVAESRINANSGKSVDCAQDAHTAGQLTAKADVSLKSSSPKSDC